MQQLSRGRQAGFSLIELMVAMTVTLVITGAVYGLIAGGQNAFRREPELSERQQNIRIAMDLILRDVANAGSGMATFTQIFTPGLNNCGACPMGLDGANRTDELQILTNAGVQDNEAVCLGDGNLRADGANTLQLQRTNTAIVPGTTLILLMDDFTWTVRNVTAVATGVAAGPAAAGEPNCTATHATLTFAAADLANDPLGLNPAGAPTLCSPSALGIGNAVPGCDVMEVAYGEVVRYRTQLDAAGVPVLQRSTSTNGVVGFQTIARGIDEFQVQYVTAGLDPTVAANWVDTAPIVSPPAAANWPSIITQVRVTLSSRSEAQNIQGVRTAVAGGPARMRGTLTATASPRSSLLALTMQPIPPPPALPPHLWR